MTLQNKKGKTKDDAIPLPDPFPLPKHYQRNVEEALEWENVNKGASNVLVRCCFRDASI